MARYKYEPASGRALGPVDPFCWIAVVPMILMAVAITFLDAVVPAVVLVVLALLLVLFDSWANRNAPRRRDRRDFDDDPVRDGPIRDDPLRDGPMHDGPMHDGPTRDGSVREGPVRRPAPGRQPPSAGRRPGR